MNTLTMSNLTKKPRILYHFNVSFWVYGEMLPTRVRRFPPETRDEIFVCARLVTVIYLLNKQPTWTTKCSSNPKLLYILNYGKCNNLRTFKMFFLFYFTFSSYLGSVLLCRKIVIHNILSCASSHLQRFSLRLEILKHTFVNLV